MALETVFRIITAVVLVAAFGISGYFRRKADRLGTPMRSNEGQRLVFFLRLYGLLALLPLVGYLIAPEWVAWARFAPPVWLRWVAVAVALACIPLIYWVFASIGINISPTQATRQGHTLVTHGPYRWVRHPLYALGTLVLISLVLVTGLWWIGVTMLPGILAIVRRTSIEEARLIETFGDDYRAYMKTTGRFFPQLWQRADR